MAPSNLLRTAWVGAVIATLSCSGTMNSGISPELLQSQIEAGRQLVQQRGCEGCHTSNAGTLAGSLKGQGFAPNLTPDKATGLGSWSDDAIIDAIRDGIDDEHDTLCSQMPRAPNLSDDDAHNLVAYLRSVPAVANEVEPDEGCQVSAKDAAHHGQRVVEAQRCASCHGAGLSGQDTPLPGTKVYGPNLTPDSETGLGDWSDEQIATALTKGTDDEGATLCSQMPRFASLTQDEVDGVVKYLKGLAAVSHETPESTCDGEHGDPVSQGKAFDDMRSCTSCHADNLGGDPRCRPGDAANLTRTGLGEWTDAQIVTAIRTGVDDEGEMLAKEMPRFSTMGDEEAQDIVAYLRSLPKVVRSCDEDPDAMLDAGTGTEDDAGSGEVDDAGSGSATDAGSAPDDAGTVVDAGGPVDAGVFDAGVVVDAGTFDAGTFDAGVTDAGAADAGSGGCSGSDVVLSQIYGGGGNVGAVYDTDYVELHNRSAHPADVSGWSVQYASAAGSSWKNAISTLPAATTIAAGGYLVIALGPTGVRGNPLPPSAIIPSRIVDMSSTSGKLVLTRDGVPVSGVCPTGSNIVDFVGYGSANCADGASPAPTLASNLAAFRSSSSGASAACVDTDVNAADFTKGAPAPRDLTVNICQCQ